jgi:tetratricopeptide (TPR) repeat protein
MPAMLGEVSAGLDSSPVGTPTLRVFISYARKDLAFVDRLAGALRERRIEPVYDRLNIEKLAVWSDRVKQLIAGCDSVLFVISPKSVTSENCAIELAIAAELNKRLAPIVLRDVADSSVPPALARLNFIFCREVDDFTGAIGELVIALETDIEWIREHTRLGELARHWEARSHADDLLLRGAELVAAFEWLSRHPPHAPAPGDLHRQLIETSIRQVAMVAAAFDEKIALLLRRAEFQQAQAELDEAIAHVAPYAGTVLASQFPEFGPRRKRVGRLIAFHESATAVYVRAGEEEFALALQACENALNVAGALEHEGWWEKLPTEDLTPREADRLKFEVHRQLLLLGGLRLQPGINLVTPRSKPSFDVMKVLRFVPTFALRAFARNGGLEALPALRKQDNPEACAYFRNAQAVGGLVRAFEAAQDRSTFPPSRTSNLVGQMADLLLTYASGPRGGKIDYRSLLARAAKTAVTTPDQSFNPADYYFLGLLNFFVAKRSDSTLAKLFSLFQGVFPDVDLHTPYDTAERLLRTGVSREPENFWPHFVLGRALLGRKDFRGAELAFNVCISIFPDYARGYEQRALALACQWRKEGYEEVARRAQEDSRRALELAGDDPSTYWPRGELLEELGDLPGAIDAFSRWMELEEDVLGRLSRGTGVKKAHDLVERLLKQRRTRSDGKLKAECLALQALVFRLWGQDENALRQANRALEIAPGHAHACTVRGMVLAKAGRLEEAIADFDTACEADRSAYLAAFSRAQTYEKLEAPEQALAAWRALATTPDGPPPPPGWMRKAAKAAADRRSRVPASGELALEPA